MPILFMRSVKVVLLLSLFLLLLPVTMASAVSKPVVAVSTVYSEKTGTVNLAVYIDSDERIAAGSFEISYDPAAITVKDKAAKAGEVLSNQLTSMNSAEAGKIAVAWAQAEDVPMKGTLVEFPASVTRDGAGGIIDLTLKNVKLFNAKGKEISVQALSGQVKPFTGVEETHAADVEANKEWTVKLSNPYNPATLNNHTVTVKKGTTDVDVIITPINATTFSVKPKENYVRGKHTLEITDQLRSAHGGKLNKPVRRIFTVK